MKITATDDVILSEEETISVYEDCCVKQTEEKHGEEEPFVQSELPGNEDAAVANRRAVHFADYPSWHEIGHLNDMTSTEMANTWYCYEEYQDIRSSYHDIVRRMMSYNPNIDNEVESTRGLEHKTKIGSRKRRANKIGAIDAVLQEQDRQILSGTRSTLAIASVYIREAQSAKADAHAKGVADANAVHGDTTAATTTTKEVEETSVTIFEDTQSDSRQRQIRAKNKIQNFFTRRRGSLVDIKNIHTTTTSSGRSAWSFESIVYLK
mmetsp:Transcript_17355/g.24389  ORF Transcript_17355/g.24389 Transcript_17355/m.24389 type:complete len:265 (+) Transcript_17355:130-924(+)